MYSKKKNFSTQYTHGLSGKPALVTSSVQLDADSGIFNLDIVKGHDTMGRGNLLNLPKMRATLEMKLDIIDFLESELSMN